MVDNIINKKKIKKVSSAIKIALQLDIPVRKILHYIEYILKSKGRN